MGMPSSDQTFGERAVGKTFNPSSNPDVENIKARCAELIDDLNDKRLATEDGDIARMLAVAITELQTAQMWAVKAVTWK